MYYSCCYCFIVRTMSSLHLRLIITSPYTNGSFTVSGNVWRDPVLLRIGRRRDGRGVEKGLLHGSLRSRFGATKRVHARLFDQHSGRHQSQWIVACQNVSSTVPADHGLHESTDAEGWMALCVHWPLYSCSVFRPFVAVFYFSPFGPLPSWI